MIVDLNSQHGPAGERFDVCIVGAGAVGIVMASDLVARGYRVALLESGGVGFERRAQAFCAGASGPAAFQGLYNGRCRTLGGTTTLWGGQILPIDSHVLQGRPGIGGAWPIEPAELADGYARALQMESLGSAPPAVEEIWRAAGVSMPPLGEAFELAFSRWCPVTDFARLHGRTLREHARLTVYLHATVTGVRFHDDGRTVRAVRVDTFDHTHIELLARHFVLAVGGIETCRLLLQPEFSDGPMPWQRHGWVGKHFQDHIACTLGTLEGVGVSSVHFDYQALDGLKYHPKFKLRPAWQKRYRTLDVCGTAAPTRAGVDDLERAYETYRLWRTRQWGSLGPARAAHFLRHLHRLLWQRLPAGRLRSPAAATLRFCVHCEQSPDSPGRITLASERDAFGLFRAHVDWRFDPLELHSIRTCARLFDATLRDAGAGRLIVDPGLEDDATLAGRFRESFHHLGGARMSVQAEQGVVDPQLRVHGTRNLFVCSSAVFPSAGFANPTHTLIALALRLTQHLHRSDSPAMFQAAAGTRRGATGFAGPAVTGQLETDRARSARATSQATPPLQR